MRRHGQKRPNGHHPGSPHARDHDVMCSLQRAGRRGGQLRNGQLLRCRTPQLPAAHSGKRGAKPVYAAEIFIAAGLIDLPFAPQRRLERQQRDAVGLHPAIAAAFADIWIDK